MKKLSFNKLTISKLDNLSTIKGGSDTIGSLGTDQSPVVEPLTDIFIQDENHQQNTSLAGC